MNSTNLSSDSVQAIQKYTRILLYCKDLFVCYFTVVVVVIVVVVVVKRIQQQQTTTNRDCYNNKQQ